MTTKYFVRWDNQYKNKKTGKLGRKIYNERVFAKKSSVDKFIKEGRELFDKYGGVSHNFKVKIKKVEL